MTEQEDTRKKSRRDLLLVLLILPLGVLCMFMAGQVAIRLAPKWVLDADMRSLLDPNAEFAAGGKPLSIQPLDPNILTLPAWGNLFLTPNAIFPTRIISTATPPPPAHTPPPPVVNTPGDDPEPTGTAGGPIIIPTHGGPTEADLFIEKSDNSRTYTPGTSINYTILVTNLGPNDAPRFNVTDNIPAVITGLSVNCTPANLCGTNTSSGNSVSYTGANLPFSGVNQITITVSGTVASGATGNLSNTAEVVIPSGSRYRDPNPANNIVTDTDTQLSVYDLAITKSDGVDTYTASAPINYTIVVTNSGPSDGLGIGIADNIPAQIASWTWVCTTVINAGGCNGVTNSTSNFTDTVNVRLGGRIEYSVSANPALLPQNPQNLSNTARIVLPGGPNFVDPNLNNNSATDVNSPIIDLQITKIDTDGLDTFTPGGAVSYAVTATNNSTFNLTGVSVIDNLSPMFSSWTWSCAPGPGASCTLGPLGTSINDTAVNLPPGGSVTYTINATVHLNAAGTLENTASVAPPAGLVDADLNNNTASDTPPDISIAGEPDIGPPDGTVISPPAGTTSTYVFNPPIVNDGTSAPDFVYYELDTGTGIALDLVIVELSPDGISWTQVFNWGDDLDDTNTNMSLAIIGDGGFPGDPEYDDRPIDYVELYNNTGITIDIDSLGLSGSFPWIRFICPAIGTDTSCDIDAIQPYYP